MSRRIIILGLLLAGSVSVSGIIFDGSGKAGMAQNTEEICAAEAAESTEENYTAENTEETYTAEAAESIEETYAAEAAESIEETYAVETVEVLAIAQVTNYVNVRAEPDTESEVLGKLYNESAATVMEQTADGWYRIQSGSVEGYVKAEYVVVGDAELEKAVGTRYAKVNTTTLFVRSEPTTEAKIITMLPEGDDLVVTDEAVEGWAKVSTEEGDGYISTEYVILSTEYRYAESKAEEEERLAREAAAAREAARAAEAARKAQAAAEAQLQQSAAQQNKVPGSGNSNGSSTSGSSNNSSSSTSGSSNNSSSSTSGNGSTSNSTSSGSNNNSSSTVSNGQAVVNYAMKFLGNPYVYGGTSLTDGVDCSGFVMRVYEAFGVKLPRTSAEQRSAGYGVNLSEIMPGDIVCYSGHVGIYTGNNTIIHASTAETGIILTTPVTYRNVLAVRRIF